MGRQTSARRLALVGLACTIIALSARAGLGHAALAESAATASVKCTSPGPVDQLIAWTRCQASLGYGAAFGLVSLACGLDRDPCTCRSPVWSALDPVCEGGF